MFHTSAHPPSAVTDWDQTFIISPEIFQWHSNWFPYHQPKQAQGTLNNTARMMFLKTNPTISLHCLKPSVRKFDSGSLPKSFVWDTRVFAVRLWQLALPSLQAPLLTSHSPSWNRETDETRMTARCFHSLLLLGRINMLLNSHVACFVVIKNDKFIANN